MFSFQTLAIAGADGIGASASEDRAWVLTDNGGLPESQRRDNRRTALFGQFVRSLQGGADQGWDIRANPDTSAGVGFMSRWRDSRNKARKNASGTGAAYL